MTSGACGPLLSLLALIASISSAEPASGFSSLTSMPGYLALKLAMMSPQPHQSCGSAIVDSMPSALAAS